jgi:hypothetical protein
MINCSNEAGLMPLNGFMFSLEILINHLNYGGKAFKIQYEERVEACPFGFF